MIPRSDLRAAVHAGTGLLSLTLGVLPHGVAVALAGLGVVVGFVVLPLTPLEAALRRPGEPWFCGLRTYPLAVFLAVVLLPAALAASTWAILAAGDAAAGVVGRRVPSPRVLGHPKATIAGSAALLAAAFVAGEGAGLVVAATGGGSAAPAWHVAAASAAAALADLLPVPPDDNLPIAVAAGAVLAALA